MFLRRRPHLAQRIADTCQLELDVHDDDGRRILRSHAKSNRVGPCLARFSARQNRYVNARKTQKVALTMLVVLCVAGIGSVPVLAGLLPSEVSVAKGLSNPGPMRHYIFSLFMSCFSDAVRLRVILIT